MKRRRKRRRRTRTSLEALGFPGRNEPLFMAIVADVSIGKYPEASRPAKDGFVGCIWKSPLAATPCLPMKVESE